MDKRKKRGSKWLLWVAVIAVVAVLAVFAWPSISSLLGGNSQGAAPTSGNVGTASTQSASSGATQGSYTSVTKGNMQVTVYGAGNLKPQQTYSVYNDAEGKLEEISVLAGDTVKEGDVIARMSSSDIETNIATYEKDLFSAQVSLGAVRDTGSDYYVYSPSAGTLKTLMCEVDDDVASVMKQYGYLAIISRDDKMRVEFEPEGSFDLTIGDKVSVWIDGTAVTALVDQTVGLGSNIAITLPDEDYEVGLEVLVTTVQGEKIGTGIMEINMPIPTTAIGGEVSTVYYEEGDSIGSGYKLFYTTGRLPSSELQEALLNYEEARTTLDNEKKKQDSLIIRAPIDGVITSVDASEGARLDESLSIVTMQSATQFQVVATVDELDVINVSLGQQVNVEVDAYPDEVFSGTVERISGVGTVSGGVATYEVTVIMDENAKLMDGMTASIEITVANKADALMVPVEAIATSNGQKYVTLATGMQTTVTTGLSNDDYVEIVSGVSEGDSVLITRSTSDTSATSSFGMTGSSMPMGGMMNAGGGQGGGTRRN